MTREEKEHIGKYILEMAKLLEDGCYQQEILLGAVHIIDEALEQEPRKGHWVSHREHCENLGVTPSGLGAYEWCSNCDCGIDVREWYRNHYNYCPNCGAKMVEPQESEDNK